MGLDNYILEIITSHSIFKFQTIFLSKRKMSKVWHEVTLMGLSYMYNLKALPINYDDLFGWSISNRSKKVFLNSQLGETEIE